MRYDVILFDIDDTLFDFNISEKNALHRTFCAFGLPTGVKDHREKYKEVSKVLWGDFEQGNISITTLGVERFKRLFEEKGIEIDADLFSHTYLENLGREVHLIEGALELCEQLTGCRLGVITNGFGQVQTSRIQNSSLCDRFEQIIISEDTGFQKPDKRIFDYAFSKLQITNKSKVLMVGDSLTSDIQGGINYGIDTCWFNPNHQENHLGIQPTYEIDQLIDLIHIIGHKKIEEPIK